MPKERVCNSNPNDFADLMVGWSKAPDGKGEVEISPASLDLPGRSGGYYFHPHSPESIGLTEGESCGPIVVHLDRGKVNRLIRVLRRARDDAFGADA